MSRSEARRGRGARGRRRRAGARRAAAAGVGGSSASASSRSRSHSLPSGRPTKASIASAPPSTRAWTPTGVAQLASSRRTAARSAVSSRIAVEVDDRAGGRRWSRSSPTRTCSASAPWPGGRDHLLDRDREADLLLAAEPAQAGGGEDDRVELALGELAQAGVDVAVQLLDPQVGARRQQLGAAAQAGGADPRALGRVVERAAGADPDVGRVLARRHRGDLQPLRHLARQVLGRVDADLGLAGQQRPLDPAHEARLVARLAVGGGLDQLRPAEQLGDPAAPGSAPACCPGWRCAAPSAVAQPCCLRRSSVTLAPRSRPRARSRRRDRTARAGR